MTTNVPPPTWYPVAASKALGAAPLAFTFQGRRLVLFRDGSKTPHALEDRCPHRGVSLSLGRVRDGALACAYHGWRFDGSGACVHVPSALAHEPPPRCQVPSVPCVEHQSTIWVSDAAQAPEALPAWPHHGEPGYDFLELENRLACPPLPIIQNFVDCAHTGILHRGLFRSEPSREIRAHLAMRADGVAVENFGETNPKGLLIRMLARGEGAIRHTDTFRAPHTVEVNYWWGERHLVTTSICTPVDAATTLVFTRIALRFGWMTPVLLRAIRPLTQRVFDQDRVILEDQARQLARHPGAPRASSVSDVPCLWVEEAHRHATGASPTPVSEREKDISYRL